MRKLSIFISTCFGTGYFPVAPGTFGSLFALCFYFLIPESVLAMSGDYWYLSIGGVLLISIVGTITAFEAEKTLGHDDKRIVIDEFAGYYLSVILLPKSIFVMVAGFVLFRIFDILKPYPINKIQDLRGGYGIMADDLLAGIISNIIIRLLLLIPFIEKLV